jgi:hypothetical protein
MNTTLKEFFLDCQIPTPVLDNLAQSVEIIDYVDRLGKIYNRCLMVADDLPCGSEFEAADRRDVATTIFLQTIRHFDL